MPFTPPIPVCDAAEFERRNEHLAKLAAYFRVHAMQWIESGDIEHVSESRNAWRTRVSDCRRKLGMTIENKQQRITMPSDGKVAVLSWYRYVPYQPLGPSAETVREQQSLF